MVPVPDSVLDTVLTLQIAVAWAGEGLCEPPRLGWWRTDLVDPAGGGDLFARLTPRTGAWSALDAVLDAARRTDARLRRGFDTPDRLRTLFHLGFELDERLRDRLQHHKRAGVAPQGALGELPAPDAAFRRDAFATWLQGELGPVGFKVVPGGRELAGPPPSAPELLAGKLAAALVPFADTYPLPFYRVTA